MFPIICDSPEDLEAKITSITGQPATSLEPSHEVGPLQVSVTSGDVTFVTLLDGEVCYLLGTCPSCDREHRVDPYRGPGYGTGPRAAYRHLVRKLDQPARGPLGRRFRRAFGCGCQMRTF